MTESEFIVACPVTVAYHTFDLADEGTSASIAHHHWSNGLVSSQPGQATLWTGIHTGTVNVSVDVRRHPPAAVDADTWDEVVDHSITTRTGAMHLTSPMTVSPDLPALTPSGPGTYRLRVHARGRDTAPDGAPSEPAEDYLLTLWPADPAPDHIHKQTDQMGNELRSQRPRPAPSHQPEPDAIRQQMRSRLRRHANQGRGSSDN